MWHTGLLRAYRRKTKKNERASLRGVHLAPWLTSKKALIMTKGMFAASERAPAHNEGLAQTAARSAGWVAVLVGWQLGVRAHGDALDISHRLADLGCRCTASR